MSRFWARIAKAFGSIDPVNEPIDGSLYAWVRIERGNPHAGMASFSDASECPFDLAVKLVGCNAVDARSEFMGRVIDWDKIGTPAGAITMTIDEMRGKLR